MLKKRLRDKRPDGVRDEILIDTESVGEPPDGGAVRTVSDQRLLKSDRNQHLHLERLRIADAHRVKRPPCDARRTKRSQRDRPCPPTEVTKLRHIDSLVTSLTPTTGAFRPSPR